MSDDGDHIDPELAALYAADRASPLAPDATARVLAGVLATITSVSVAGVKPSAGRPAARAISFKAAIAFGAAGAIAGGVAVTGYRHLTAVPQMHVPAPPSEPMPPPAEPATLPLDAPAAAVTVDPRPAPVTVDAAVDAIVPPDASRRPAGRPPKPPSTVAANPPRSADSADTREPLLIDRARAALHRGLIDEALATLMRHERVHPAGALAEERDVLIIEAYVAKREAALARRRIERYRRDHPAGFLHARVDAAEAALASR